MCPILINARHAATHRATTRVVHQEEYRGQKGPGTLVSWLRPISARRGNRVWYPVAPWHPGGQRHGGHLESARLPRHLPRGVAARTRPARRDSRRLRLHRLGPLATTADAPHDGHDLFAPAHQHAGRRPVTPAPAAPRMGPAPPLLSSVRPAGAHDRSQAGRVAPTGTSCRMSSGADSPPWHHRAPAGGLRVLRGVGLAVCGRVRVQRGELPMKGLVLSGGLGTRLRPLTYTGAKQLVPIANKPVLYYALEDLVEAGITEIGIVVGDTHAQIREAVGDGSQFGARVTYLEQDAPRGIAHGILIAREFLGDDPFVLFLGDNFLREGIVPFV